MTIDATVRMPPSPVADPPWITVTYALTVADIRAAGFTASWYSLSTNAIGAFVTSGGAAMFLVTRDPVNLLFVILGLSMLSGALKALLMSLSTSRRPDLLRGPFEMSVTDIGMRTVTPVSTGEVRWATFKRVRATASTYLMEVGTGPVGVVPKRARTADQQARFEAMAAQAGVLDRSSARRPLLLGIALGILANVAIFLAVVITSNFR